METANLDGDLMAIAARSRRQAMDWSLVLASQEIPTTIVRPDENQWVLMVEPRDYERAVEAIRQFRLENRRWSWNRSIAWTGSTFHWIGIPWACVLAVFYRLSMIEFPVLLSEGKFNTIAVAQGEWWRLFTAVFLHADPGHLLANLTTGILLLGLAAGRFGPGCALLAGLLTGAAGNIAGFFLYREPYSGLGASGMVMGALGLIAVHNLSAHWGFRHLLRALAGGILLFVLLGLDPTSDIVAHAGGFVAGALISVLLLRLPPEIFEQERFQAINWIILTSLTLLTWILALAA